MHSVKTMSLFQQQLPKIMACELMSISFGTPCLFYHQPFAFWPLCEKQKEQFTFSLSSGGIPLCLFVICRSVSSLDWGVGAVQSHKSHSKPLRLQYRERYNSTSCPPEFTSLPLFQQRHCPAPLPPACSARDKGLCRAALMCRLPCPGICLKVSTICVGFTSEGVCVCVCARKRVKRWEQEEEGGGREGEKREEEGEKERSLVSQLVWQKEEDKLHDALLHKKNQTGNVFSNPAY